MIDTMKLEKIIAATMRDGKIMHHAVASANHSPTFLDVHVNYVHTHDNAATVSVLMHWNPQERTAEGAVGNPALGRYKWLAYVAKRLNSHSREGIEFVPDVDSFEFGIGYLSDKTAYLYASLIVLATQT